MDRELALGVPLDMSDATRPVVMVDDEQLDYKLAERFYRRAELANPFLWFDGGARFLEYLGAVKRSEAPLPVLVLLDLNMPRMSGFDVLDAIRRDQAFASVPVVSILSSSSDVNDRERATLAGANHYLVKPYDPRAYQTFFGSLAA